MPLNLEPSDIEIKIFQRLNDFATDNQLSLVDFWATNRLCLALDQFLQLLDNAQFKITKPEVKELQDEGVQFVNLNALIEHVQTWKNEVQSISNFIILQKEAQQQKINLKDQHKVNKDQRSKTTKIQLRMDTAASRSTFNGKIRAISRQIQAEIQLSQKLIQAKNESDYELTLKVGQANDLCKKLGKKISYLINSEEQKIKIIQLSQSGAQAVKTRNAFGKQYEQLKKQSLNKGQQIEGTLQQDLKKTLVEIMYASDQLQRQIRLLERKGIGH